MEKARRMTALVTLVLIASTFGSAAAFADIYVKQKVHTDPYTVGGKTEPAKDEIDEIWLTPQKVRMDKGESQTNIILIDKEILIGIDHDTLSYGEMSLDLSGQAEKEQPGAGALFQGLMGGMSAKVTETKETKKIGKWNCRKYLIEYSMGFGTATAEAWATTDIKVDYQLYLTASNATLASQPGFDAFLEEMKKVKGVIVYQVSVSSSMGMQIKTATEVLEFTEKKAPAGTYDVPKGYKKKGK